MVRLTRTRQRTRPRPHRPHPALLESLESRVLLSFTFTSLASLKGSVSGNQPQGLIMDAAGNLFGVTATGGAHGYGAVFEIPAQGVGTPALAGSVPLPSPIITLASFTGANGIAPRGNLVLDAQGNLFGTTLGGGAFNKGTIFEVAAGTASHITTLASFNGTNGSYPFSGLVADASGNLFGTTLGAHNSGFASTVFELASGSSAITVLATFNPGNKVSGSLAIDSSGNIFGTTGAGGAKSKGSIFKIAGSAHTLTTLASFNGSDGSGPDGTLLLDAQGNLFGLTASGGAGNGGTLFKLAATASSVTTLASFSGTKGARPIGNLLMDSGGNLFGVTANGGTKGVGTVFERAAGTANTITTLFSFASNATGFNPTGPFITDGLGNFWGTTFSGGAGNSGTIFKLHDNSVVFAPPPTPASLPNPGRFR